MSGLATSAVKTGMAIGLPIQGLVCSNCFFDHFCGGETIVKTEKTVQHLGEYNVKTILDYSVEGALHDEEGFEATAQEILRTFDEALDPNIYLLRFQNDGYGF